MWGPTLRAFGKNVSTSANTPAMSNPFARGVKNASANFGGKTTGSVGAINNTIANGVHSTRCRSCGG